MVDGVLGDVHQRALDIAFIVEVAIFVGLLYVGYIAPYRIITQQANARDFVAGIPGLAFWAYAILELARWSA